MTRTLDTLKFLRGDVAAITDKRNVKYGDVVIICRADRDSYLVRSVVNGALYVPPKAHLGRSFGAGYTHVLATLAAEGK